MKIKTITTVMLTLILASMLSMAFVTPVSANSSVELWYDDGSAESSAFPFPLWQYAVRFSLPPGWTEAKILTARYNLSSHSYPFNLHVYNSLKQNQLTLLVNKPGGAGWFNVDLTGYNLIVNGDFYISIEFAFPTGPPPYLFLENDRTPPHQGRSYTINDTGDWSTNTNLDWMIRAVVEPVDPVFLLEDLYQEIQDLPREAFKYKWITRWQKRWLCKQVDWVIRKVESDNYSYAMWSLKGLKRQIEWQIVDPSKTELIDKIDTIMGMLESPP